MDIIIPNKKIKKIATILSIFILMCSCDIVKQLGGAYNLSQCKYNFKSIENIEVAGIGIKNNESISISEIAKLSTILGGKKMKTIPFTMTLQLDVNNPNRSSAYLNGMEYMLELNEMEITTGKLDTLVRIDPEGSAVIPLTIGVDIQNLMNRYSKDKISTEIRRIFGIIPGKTKFTLKLWPKVLIGNVRIKSPSYIPVSFTIGE